MPTLKEFFKADKFAAHAGVELLDVSATLVKARMLVTEEHLNAGGVCQGGALFTLADLACAAISNSKGKLALSVTANITYLQPAKLGYVYAEARELGGGFRVPFIEVRITDEAGNLLALMTSSCYRKDVSLPVFEG